jgi:hypothetical protein
VDDGDLDVPSVAAACSFWFVLLRMGRTQQQEQWKTNPALTQLHTTRITPQHLYNRDATGENIAYWQSLHEVAEDEHCLYFFNTKDSAYVVPGARFADAAQAEHFYRAALATGTKRAAPMHSRRYRSRKALKGLIVSDDIAIHNALSFGRRRRILFAPDNSLREQGHRVLVVTKRDTPLRHESGKTRCRASCVAHARQNRSAHCFQAVPPHQARARRLGSHASHDCQLERQYGRSLMRLCRL